MGPGTRGTSGSPASSVADRGSPGRLAIVRVRIFELRLIAAVLTVMWAVVAALVLVGYRPGGPIDILVGLTALPPVGIAGIALAWPPTARDDRIFAATIWLGLIVGLLLVPSIGGVVAQLTARGPETIVPSLEVGYPWLLALAGTSVFTGLGIARHFLGPGSRRRRRLFRGLALGVGLTIAAGSPFAAAALANGVALADHPAAASRFGPTDPALVLPPCNGPLTEGASAVVELDITADVDQHPIGSVQILGLREGSDIRWTANVATSTVLGQYGAIRAGGVGWLKDPGGAWTLSSSSRLDQLTLDRRAIDVALRPGDRTAAENRGIEYVEGARARHCRIAIDGPTFLAAFPEAAWFAAGTPDLHPWRGELDFWLFGDDEVGQLAVTVNGDAAAIGATGIQATIRATMTATDRGSQFAISPPS